MVVLIFLSLGFVYYLLKRTKTMTKQNKVDAENLADMEIFPQATLFGVDFDPKSEVKPTPRTGHEMACGPIEELDEE